MLEEAKKAKGIAEWQKPAVDSEQIKSWDERIAVCADVSSTVKQSAVSQPGMASGIVASLFPKKTEAETVTSSNFKANVAEQTVKAATTKLTSAQEVYKSTMATYQAMNEQKDKMAAELTKARAEVAELQMQSVTAVCRVEFRNVGAQQLLMVISGQSSEGPRPMHWLSFPAQVQDLQAG